LRANHLIRGNRILRDLHFRSPDTVTINHPEL
jgi:hypothetical protein